MHGGAFTGVIALDGPSGTGKSTVARRLASALGARYLDTGAMYRALTVAALDAAVALDDTSAVLAATASAEVTVSTDPTDQQVRVDGVDVTERIRSAEVTAAVSAVSAVPELRSRLVAQQRELIGDGGIVVEGRDIGSVVWPSAVPKVYLTASEEVRALRRAGQLGRGGDGEAVAAVAADIQRRDHFDSTRAASPAVRPDGSVEVDTSELTIDEVVKLLVDMTL
jgi:cytidylate kinase